jgi:hypothetical protein
VFDSETQIESPARQQCIQGRPCNLYTPPTVPDSGNPDQSPLTYLSGTLFSKAEPRVYTLPSSTTVVPSSESEAPAGTSVVSTVRSAPTPVRNSIREASIPFSWLRYCLAFTARHAAAPGPSVEPA